MSYDKTGEGKTCVFFSQIIRNFHNTSQRIEALRERETAEARWTLSRPKARRLASNDVPLALEKYQCALAFANTNVEKALSNLIQFRGAQTLEFYDGKTPREKRDSLETGGEKGILDYRSFIRGAVLRGGESAIRNREDENERENNFDSFIGKNTFS